MNGEVSMKKNALLALLLVMALVLSSCSLIVKDEMKDAKSVILRLGDDVVTKAEVNAATNDVLYELYDNYYNMYGQRIDITDPEIVASARSTAVTRLKQDMVIRAKAKELGLDQLTEEETAKAKETAQSNMEFAKTYVQTYMVSSELEGEELEKATQEALDSLGVSLEKYEKAAADQIVDDKVREYVVKDVTVPDEDVKADYDAKVAADQEKYAEDASAWTNSDRTGTTLYYAPAGIRRVKQILLKYKDEDQALIDAANEKITAANTKVTDAEKALDDLAAAAAAAAKTTEATEAPAEPTAAPAETAENADAAEAAETAEETPAPDEETLKADLEAAKTELEAAQNELKAAVDTAFAHLDEDADALLAALEADPDSWDTQSEEKNGDPGMKAGALNAEKGYAVCAGMSGFDPAFVDAAMALESVGQVSGKIRGESYGYYIIKYVSDVAEGPVDYDSVKDGILNTLLTAKKNSTYSETLSQWVDAAGIREDLGALND